MGLDGRERQARVLYEFVIKASMVLCGMCSKHKLKCRQTLRSIKLRRGAELWRVAIAMRIELILYLL